MYGKIGLLLVDIQNGFNSSSWGERDTPDAEENISRILKLFRDKKYQIYHVQHLSKNQNSELRPGQIGVEFMEIAKPIYGERIFQKNVNSSFIGTQLENILRQDDIQNLVIIGISVDHCVSTTARMGANLGFKISVISDATIAHDRTGFDGTKYKADLVHAITLASLHNEFANVLTTKSLIEILN